MKGNTIQMIKHTYQQGDIKFRKLDKMPTGDRKTLAKGRCVLAHGESGNVHLVEQDDAELIQIGERMLLTVASPAPVKHGGPGGGEHGSRTLSPGIWEVGQVREHDYFKDMVRPVVD